MKILNIESNQNVTNDCQFLNLARALSLTYFLIISLKKHFLIMFPDFYFCTNDFIVRIVYNCKLIKHTKFPYFYCSFQRFFSLWIPYTGLLLRKFFIFLMFIKNNTVFITFKIRYGDYSCIDAKLCFLYIMISKY